MTDEEAKEIARNIRKQIPSGIVMIYDPEKDGAYVSMKEMTPKRLMCCLATAVYSLTKDDVIDGEEMKRLITEAIDQGIITRAIRDIREEE